MGTPASGHRRRGRPPKGTRGDTRQELIDAALRLFANQGYAATTVRQIADEVGIRDSAIYAHFDAKQDLLDTLIDESGPNLIDNIGFDFVTLSDQPPDKVLPAFFDKLVAAWDRPRPRQLISLITREGFEPVPDILATVRERFLPHIRRWAKEDALRSDVPATMLVWELTTPLAAIRILHLNAQASPQKRKEGRRLARAHVTYFLTTAAP